MHELCMTVAHVKDLVSAFQYDKDFKSLMCFLLYNKVGENFFFKKVKTTTSVGRSTKSRLLNSRNFVRLEPCEDEKFKLFDVC